MLLSLSRAGNTARAFGAHRPARALSSRAAQVLASFDIKHGLAVPGVYNGEWLGSGEPLVSVCPATGEELARVASVRAQVS